MFTQAPKVFYIPKDVDYIIVADMFAEDYTGGAELTLEAILSKCPGKVFKIHSSSVTPKLIEQNKDKHWVLGNFASMSHESLIELVVDNVKFSIIECDYKYCRHRSSHLHFLQEKVPCDCHKQKVGQFIRGLFQRAQHVFFMSAAQMQVYVDLFPQHPPTNFHVQTSTFKDETLDKLAEFHKTRNNTTNTWAIMGGGSWIKAEQQTISWCQSQGLEYEVFGGMPHDEFLKKLSTYKGLVFRPEGLDTCPRLVIESKLMGLECKLNENVQHKDEEWYAGSVEQANEYLRTRGDIFWKTLAK